MSVRLSCPSCNTAFALDAIPANRRASCPRCGDVFPIRGVPTASEDSEQKTEDSREPTSPFPNTKHEIPNAKAGLSPQRALLLALMLGLLGLAAGFAVYYTRERPKPTPPEPPSELTATPPAQLVGLGYLPAECNVICAVQSGPILAYASRTKQDPRELLMRTGVPQQVLAAIDQINLTLPQIDHIAGGTFIADDRVDPRITFVIVLKQPLADEDAFLKKLKAKPMPGGKGWHNVEVGSVPLTLARVSPIIWVFGWSERDFSAVEKGGFGPGGTQFRGSESEGLRKMIASVPPDAALWIAADDERDWTQKPLIKLAEQVPQTKKWLPEWLPAIRDGRGGLLAVSLGEKPRMRLFVRTADSATAERVRTYFQARAAEMESATAGGGGVFAMFDAPFDPATSGNTLQRFLDDAKK